MQLIIVTVAGASLFLSAAAQQSTPKYRRITMQGCVQATGRPTEFLLAVPGDVPRAIRGIAKGESVPANAGVGSEPRPDPQSVPPLSASHESGLPEGRYSTPTIVNHSYKLLNLPASRLKALVGKGVEVVGEIPVEGYPTGDEPVAGQTARALVSVLNPPFRAKTIKAIADSCVALMQSK